MPRPEPHSLTRPLEHPYIPRPEPHSLTRRLEHPYASRTTDPGPERTEDPSSRPASPAQPQPTRAAYRPERQRAGLSVTCSGMTPSTTTTPSVRTARTRTRTSSLSSAQSSGSVSATQSRSVVDLAR